MICAHCRRSHHMKITSAFAKRTPGSVDGTAAGPGGQELIHWRDVSAVTAEGKVIGVTHMGSESLGRTRRPHKARRHAGQREPQTYGQQGTDEPVRQTDK
ncbi:hypothetical protein SKAU_G00406940 [Synaphobranchus kaupii]|uniref:Uncharacterized protein n=1 Tax=Synaphobranchus kaupii TaxID=118154 RepID=A0A9Q1IC42_SYNKA|nr:hypothetical protein SKAU_G00406940 [Synaphobranchus kaupii]